MSFTRMVIASFALAFATNGSLAQSAPWEAAPQQQLPSGSPFVLQAPETGVLPVQQANVSPFALSVTQPGAAQSAAPAAPRLPRSMKRPCATTHKTARSAVCLRKSSG